AGGADGLVISSGNSTVRGLVLIGFATALRLQTNGGNVIRGNFIGLGAAGTNAPGNSGDGIYVSSASNVIGGTGANERNDMAANPAPRRALRADGRTANDSGDPDLGPNRLQNFPLLSDAQSEDGVTTIDGTLNSLGNAAYRLDFFLNDTTDPTGYGEGAVYIGSANVTVDASGSQAFSASFVLTATYLQFITATATDPA